MAREPKIYRLNLVRSMRENERRQERRGRIQAMVGMACFGILFLSIAYSGYTMWEMEGVLSAERKKLAQVQAEYNKYTGTRMIVEKGDVELLTSLQGRGIFWTKKLAALATHLPDNYTITKFSYLAGELRVSGVGPITSRQDQLLVLDAYLDRLRADSSFANIFKQVYLNEAQDKGESSSGRVTFDLSFIFPGGQVRR